MRRRKLVLAVLGAAFCLVASQAASGPLVSGLLRRSLERQATAYSSLVIRVAPLGWLNLFRGNLPGVAIKASDLSFGGPCLAMVDMRLRSIRLDRRLLFWHGRVGVIGLGESKVMARVEAAALNEFRQRAYPLVPALLQIREGGVGLTGGVRLLGQDVYLRTFGKLTAIGGDRLRYVPESIEIAGRTVPAAWLSSYRQQLALDFPVALPLPLALRRVSLHQGYAELIWEEGTGGQGDKGIKRGG